MNLLLAWLLYCNPDVAQATSILTIIGIGVAAAGVAVSAKNASDQKKANKSNNEAFNEATRLNEKEAREIYDNFISQYNRSKEKLEEGLTLQQYVENVIQALGNPRLEEEYRKARHGDWEQAQEFADAATKQNISAFNMLVDNVSGGDYKALVAARNKAALGEDIDALYSEAQRLRNPRVPEGSVKKDSEGNVVGGQRADKFEFSVATSTIKEQNDRVFAKSRTAIEDDRVAAQRQQEKAINFLPFLNYAEFATTNVVRPFEQNQLAAQLAELQLEAGLASNAMGAALGAPSPPPIINTAAADAQTAQSVQQTAALLANLYQRQGTGTTSTTQSRADTNPSFIANETSGRGSGTQYF